MQICCTQKVLKVLKVKPIEVYDADFFCWSVNVDTIGRQQLFWFSNDATRISFALYDLNPRDIETFTEIVYQAMSKTFELYGYTPEQIQQYFELAGEVAFTKTRGPRNVGRLNAVMNDFIAMELPINTAEMYQYTFVEKMNQMIVKFDKTHAVPTEQLTHFFNRLATGESLNLDGTMIGQLPGDLRNAKVANNMRYQGNVMEKRDAFDLIVQLQLGFEQPVRRIIVPTDKTFADLHLIIQAAYFWENRHEYQFEIETGKNNYHVVMQDAEGAQGVKKNVEYKIDKQTKLSELLAPNMRFTYTYDLNDEWEHSIYVRRLDQTAYPVCLLGSGARPPEGIGGVSGYNFLIEMLGSIELLPKEEQMHIDLLLKELKYFEPNMKKINEKMRYI
ncbi:MAG: plasmid pRiA4b ORF-3 family protein [Culicoidibacterales bacterium]